MARNQNYLTRRDTDLRRDFERLSDLKLTVQLPAKPVSIPVGKGQRANISIDRKFEVTLTVAQIYYVLSCKYYLTEKRIESILQSSPLPAVVNNS